LQLCALDFKEENLLKGPRLPFKKRWARRLRSLRRERPKEQGEDPQPELLASDHGENEEPAELGVKRFTGGQAFGRMTSRASSFHSMMERTRPIPSTAPLDAIDARPAPSDAYQRPIAAPSKKWTLRLAEVAKGLVTPVSCAILVAIPCAIVQPLKALFVIVPGWSQTRIPFAPDGRPPLAFVMETTQFIGGITIPSALILLGASFARLKVGQWSDELRQVPARWKDLPIAAIFAMTTIKSESACDFADAVVLMPAFGM
jgi:hypothetical protein